MKKPAKKSKASSGDALKAIFKKYADKEVPTKEVRQMGHVFYHLDQDAAPLKDLRNELKAIGYELLVDRSGSDTIIEQGRGKKDKRVIATVGGKGISQASYIVDFKIG